MSDTAPLIHECGWERPEDVSLARVDQSRKSGGRRVRSSVPHPDKGRKPSLGSLSLPPPPPPIPSPVPPAPHPALPPSVPHPCRSGPRFAWLRPGFQGWGEVADLGGAEVASRELLRPPRRA